MSGESDRINQLDWDKLRVFIVVAELRSMTAAAQRLGESTPTVSRKIDQLEKALGCPLLHRTTKGVEPTEIGRVVVKHAHEMQDLTNTIWNDVSDMDRDHVGSLRIASSDGVLSNWLSARFPQFIKQYSNLTLQIKVQPTAVSLLNDDADISFAFEEPRHRDLLSTRLGIIHYMFFASPDYLDDKGRPESLFDLKGHRCLMHDGYINQVDKWSSRASELRKILKFAISTNSGTALREICANGGGIALMPSYTAEIDPRLEPLSLPELIPIEFWLTFTTRVQRLAHGRVFVDWIRQQFSKDESPWFRETFVHPRSHPDLAHIGKASKHSRTRG